MQSISTTLFMARTVCRRPSWLFPSYRQSRCHHLLRLLTFTNTPSYTWKGIISAQLMLMIFETSFVRGVKWRRYKIFAMWFTTKTILACVIIIVWGGCQQGKQLVKSCSTSRIWIPDGQIGQTGPACIIFVWRSNLIVGLRHTLTWRALRAEISSSMLTDELDDERRKVRVEVAIAGSQ